MCILNLGPNYTRGKEEGRKEARKEGGKRRRRAAQNSKDTRFFLGGGGGNNCNYPSYPSNSYPSNSNNIPVTITNPSNNYNTGSCRCTSLSWTDHYGNVNGNCQR